MISQSKRNLKKCGKNKLQAQPVNSSRKTPAFSVLSKLFKDSSSAQSILRANKAFPSLKTFSKAKDSPLKPSSKTISKNKTSALNSSIQPHTLTRHSALTATGLKPWAKFTHWAQLNSMEQAISLKFWPRSSCLMLKKN